MQGQQDMLWTELGLAVLQNHKDKLKTDLLKQRSRMLSFNSL